MRDSRDSSIEGSPSRYVVGIDLGTSNSAIAYVDTDQQPRQIQVLPIPQLAAPHQVESRETLPSFHYQATDAEAAQGSLRLPWSSESPAFAVGLYAREQASQTPGRVIASAKSWLCHSGVDRTAELLPWQGAVDVDQLSPVEVTARYLRHMTEVWNHTFAEHPLADQQLVITLPASFDEVARELTVRAAAAADLPRVVLIEEPQAAFYAWVDRHAEDWQQQVSVGQKILVCDIGGGTADFTLIRAQASEVKEGDVQFQRIAVSNHLILGGDNLDLATAHFVEQNISGSEQLPTNQWDVLLRSSRRLKEELLSEDAPPSLTLSLPGSGAKRIGGATQIEIARDQLRELLLKGFLPRCRFDEQPQSRGSGFQEFGLPYAADHAITRYLAAFLNAHRDHAHAHSEEESKSPSRLSARPDVVLLNGGFFASPVLRHRLLEVLASWFQEDGERWQPKVLDNDRLDLAVARGAAYYGMVERGEGVRITANLARSYYIGVAGGEKQAVCLAPGDAQPGREIHLQDTTFQLTIAEPVEFPLFVSSTRLTDQPGQLITLDEQQTTPLPPIRTVLRAARRSEKGVIPVELHARLTEVGTIDLWCSEQGAERSWRLQFDVRSATQTDRVAHDSAAEAEGFVDESQWAACRELIGSVFSPDGASAPASLMKELARALHAERGQWPTSLLRRVWDALMELESGRRRSAGHEARWLNLLGYSLRPGYGFALDDWRVAETWRTVRGKVQHDSAGQALILWRRVAGGLSRGQQVALADPLLAAVRALHRRFAQGKQRGKDPTLNPSASVEIWRLLGSLELLPVSLKVELGNLIVDLLPKKKLQNVRDAMVWTVGRLGQRKPVYGMLNTVVPQDTAAHWLEVLMAADEGDPIDLLAAMQLARRTDDRRRDLPASLREASSAWIRDKDGPSHLIKLILEGGTLDHEEQNQIVGEALPHGLRLL